MYRLALLLPVALAVVSAGCLKNPSGTATGTNRVAASDVKKGAKDTLDKAAAVVLQERDKYVEEMEGELAKLETEYADLKNKSTKAAEDARKKLDQQIEDLKAQAAKAEEESNKHLTETGKKREDLKKELDKARSAGADAWKDLKAGLEKAREELKKAHDQARTRFEQK